MKPLRWFARILSALIVLFHALSFVADRPPASLSSADKLHLTLWGIIMLGMLIAWKWEGIGGLVILLAFVIQIGMNPEAISMWPFWVAPFTGMLFLICWVYGRRKNEAEAEVS